MKLDKKYFKAKCKEIGFYDYTLSNSLRDELNLKVLQQIAIDTLTEAFYKINDLSDNFKDEDTACARCVISLCANTISLIKIGVNNEKKQPGEN